MNSIANLSIISVGDEDGVAPYRSSLEKNGVKNPDIDIHVYPYSEGRDPDAIIKKISALNIDRTVSGILGLTPLPAVMNNFNIYDHIAPHKDVDCQTKHNFDAFLKGENVPFAPATAEAVECIINELGLEQLKVAILGKGPAVGLPYTELCKRAGIDHVNIESWDQLNPDWEAELRNSGANVIVGAARGAHCITNDNIPSSLAHIVDVAYCLTEEGENVGNVAPEIDLDITKNFKVGARTTKIMIEHTQKANEIAQLQK